MTIAHFPDLYYITGNSNEQSVVLNLELTKVDINLETSFLAENREKSVYPERIVDERAGVTFPDINDKEVLAHLDLLSCRKKFLNLGHAHILKSLVHKYINKYIKL